MNLTAQHEQGVCKLAIEGDLTIYHAQALRTGLLEHLGANSSVEINLAGVGEIDTAGIQLLAAAKLEAERTNKTLRLVAHSPATLEAIDLYNLAQQLGDPLVIPAQA